MAKKGMKIKKPTQPEIPGIKLNQSVGRCPHCGGPVKNNACVVCGY
jgi:hypothetical protein